MISIELLFPVREGGWCRWYDAYRVWESFDSIERFMVFGAGTLMLAQRKMLSRTLLDRLAPGWHFYEDDSDAPVPG